jgi:spore coat protein GerQ
MYNNYNPINNYYHNYVDDYLKENIGKRIEVHVSFSDSIEWRDSLFKGYLDSIGKDYIVINDNDKKYVIWAIYIDYVVLL